MAIFKESEHPRDKDGKFTEKEKQDRIKELNEMVSKEHKVVKKTGNVLKNKETGKYLVDIGKETDEPFILGKNKTKKLLTDPEIKEKYDNVQEENDFVEPIDWRELEEIKKELKMLESGFDNYNEYEEFKAKTNDLAYEKQKQIANNSIFTKKARKGEDAFYDLGEYTSLEFGISYNYQSFIRTISGVAKELGAKEIYHSNKNGSKFGSSVYLKLGNTEIRFSNHELPYVGDRTLSNYSTRWNKEEVLDEISLREWAKIETEEELKKKILELFTEDDD